MTEATSELAMSRFRPQERARPGAPEQDDGSCFGSPGLV